MRDADNMPAASKVVTMAVLVAVAMVLCSLPATVEASGWYPSIVGGRRGGAKDMALRHARACFTRCIGPSKDPVILAACSTDCTVRATDRAANADWQNGWAFWAILIAASTVLSGLIATCGSCTRV